MRKERSINVPLLTELIELKSRRTINHFALNRARLLQKSKPRNLCSVRSEMFIEPRPGKSL